MKSVPKIGLLFVFLTGTVVACQTTGTKTEEPSVFHVIAYGKVDSINLRGIGSANIVFIPYIYYRCKDKGYAGKRGAAIGLYGVEHIHIGKLGTYEDTLTHRIYTRGDPVPPPIGCYKAFVAWYDSTSSSPFDYTRLLAGPKKLGSDFLHHFRKDAPFERVRIDFVVQN